MFGNGASEDQSVRSLVLNESTSLLAATYSTNEDNRYSRYEILGALDSNLTENEFKQGSTNCPYKIGNFLISFNGEHFMTLEEKLVAEVDLFENLPMARMTETKKSIHH